MLTKRFKIKMQNVYIIKYKVSNTKIIKLLCIINLKILKISYIIPKSNPNKRKHPHIQM